MSTQATLVTIEQVSKDPPRNRRWEIVNGELRTMAPAGFRHGRIAMNLATLLTEHVNMNKLGVVVAAETGFILGRDPDTLRAPDVGFVRADRVTGDETGFFDGPPDLAAEVVSPDDRPNAVNDKTRRWLEAGTRVVWVVWPDTKSVTVHRSDADPVILHEGDTLDGGDAVPGFTCNVAAIFE